MDELVRLTKFKITSGNREDRSQQRDRERCRLNKIAPVICGPHTDESRSEKELAGRYAKYARHPTLFVDILASGDAGDGTTNLLEL